MSADGQSQKSSSKSPWAVHAGQWGDIGPPLKPSIQDLNHVQAALWSLQTLPSESAVLLLGATREITALEWPKQAMLVAVDSSSGMLERCWRPPAGIGGLGVRGDWRLLPVLRGRINLVLGDGSLSALPDAIGLRKVLVELARVLLKGGKLVARIFIRLERESTVKEVLDEMRAGKFSSFHAFKWRMVMAMHESSALGAPLDVVYRTVCEAIPDRNAVADQMNWPLESINTIEAYRGSTGRYFLPRLSDVYRFVANDFDEIGCIFPAYEVGNRCPTLVLERR